MTPPSADRPGSVRPGAEPFPRVGGRTGASRPAGHDTGPVRASRPVPPLPPLPARAPVPVPDDTAVFPQAQPPSEGAPTSTAMPQAEDVQALPTTEKPVGRAGRDLRAAIGVGVSLVAVIVASLLVWRPAFLAVLTAAILVAVVELTRALRTGGFHAPLVPLLVGTLAMEALAWTRGPTGLITAFFLTALAVLLWRLAPGPAGYRRDAAAGVLVALYVPLLAGFAVLLLVPEDGAARVLAFIATVVASDVGGYVAGVLFGKHPMAPSISPKKSWEGLGGSVLACMLVATPIIVFALDGPWWGGLLFGAALAVSATVGDLAESLIKRDLGIKDMGNLLPGHGGIMDRLDSLLPSAAAAYLLLSVLAP
ncbi:phosphatidate cytidylyltransferase [Blastococcus saxobsidens]|uniref:Phosphatidate cytidylyltransferase n=1 Tax=Blastococcus saxobsidens TaxID=138336 RepID=A0A4V2G2D2_9ACTN|nr:phosphatidate cytidylyltransferase [Blastococcus saxobsidens]RZU32686.1 phosphatidate cytidylyltransferase [Blastococcus saxobsidens]